MVGVPKRGSGRLELNLWIWQVMAGHVLKIADVSFPPNKVAHARWVFYVRSL